MRGSVGARCSWSLLAKTLAQFAVCAVACFALTAPLFFLLTKYYYAEDLIEVVEAVGSGGAVSDIDLEQDVIEGLMLQFLLVFAIISVALFITMRFATKRLWRPFDDSLRKAEAFNLAQGDIPSFGLTRIKEFDRLNRSLESLMAKDRETFRIQKEFTENASHELQMPLAVFRSKRREQCVGRWAPARRRVAFRRFRAGDVRSKGNGLGLAIVKALCDFLRWRVEYRFVGGCHVCVVSFPSVLA